MELFPILTIFFLILGNGSVDLVHARAYFVFGDSSVDNGNNNYLTTVARADRPPYGIDFPLRKPTGRFSNGLNLVDLIGEHLGLAPNVPYLDPELKGDKLLSGANFASAGVGILNETGIQFLRIIGIQQQLDYFREYQARVKKLIGAAETTKLVSESLTLITLGGNDFVNNYYLFPITIRSLQFSVPDYCTFLVSQYQIILQELYELGPGKVIVTAAGPIGCAPAELASRSANGQCVAELQNAANLFNSKTRQMILDLNKKIGKDIFVFSDTYEFSNRIITNPQAYGFENSGDACCGQGLYNGVGLCLSLSNLCQNREKYVWWDAYHPTERGNRLIVQQMFNSSTDFMTPMNLSTIKANFIISGN